MREWLKALRENKNVTQQSVAESLGVTRQYYQQIETGNRQYKMDLETATKLAAFFGISVEDVQKYELKEDNT